MKGKYLLLGTNEGERIKNLERALRYIDKNAGRIVRLSAVYETEAWGYRAQPAFYNLVVEISTTCNPEELLDVVKTIERKMGRESREKWRQRVIDIDILYYDNEVIKSGDLTVPHPEIPNRRFTLVPLCEISASEVHPVLGKTNGELLSVTGDQLKVKKATDQVRL